MTYKAWQNYKEQELVDIYNGKDWDNFFEFQCALESIPFLPDHYGPKPIKCPEEADLTIYTVKDIKFKNKEDADKIYSLLTSMELCGTSYLSGVSVVKQLKNDAYNYPHLSTDLIYSKELYEKVKSDLADYESRIKAWERIKKTYVEVEDLRSELHDDIFTQITKTNKKNASYKDMTDKHEKYLKLANGDEKIALKFLTDSCPYHKEQFPDFFENDEKEEYIDEEQSS